MSKRIIRVFPRQTKATPDDELVAINRPPGFFDQADEVHISVTWTWDLPKAERLASLWQPVGPVKIGGPATGMKGEEFKPGMYLKKGYVITSRGCPNRCWFCSVWKREGNIRELPITEGYNVTDDNILACSDQHIKSVFKMLKKQKEPIEFTGGIEAVRLKPWMAEAMKDLKAKQVFFAYDTPDDLKPLMEAGKMMIEAGFTTASHALRCYVLCGYKGDTISKAVKRIKEAIMAGFLPMAMLYRDQKGQTTREWSQWQRQFTRPIMMSKIYGELSI